MTAICPGCAETSKSVSFMLTSEVPTLESASPIGLRSWVAIDRGAVFCGLTLELTLPTEVGSVSLVRDDASRAADQAYAGCRSGSALSDWLGLPARAQRTGRRGRC